MGNARATKFLNGHCPPLPVPSFFLMGIAHVCPCPKIVPITQHQTHPYLCKLMALYLVVNILMDHKFFVVKKTK